MKIRYNFFGQQTRVSATLTYTEKKEKNVYIEKLDNIVNEYNNTYHRTIKMESSDVLSLVIMLNTMLILMITILNFNW